MKIYSYIVARDFGFAPNPFYSYCTLATCKPVIRRCAKVHDWVVGTGSKTRGREGHIVFVMRITESMSFNNYWLNPRFKNKQPNLRGSKKQAYGDNIYYRDPYTKKWGQVDSHHSLPDGTPNRKNVNNDTQTDRVLISDDYIYWGDEGPQIPERYRDFCGFDLCKIGMGHKCNFPDNMVFDFVNWIRSLGGQGYCGTPLDWSNSP